MATTKTKPAAKQQRQRIEYPPFHNLNGILTFPLWSVDHLEKVKEWRNRKNIKPPKFPDKVGGWFLVTAKTAEAFAKYMEDVYLPFVTTLYDQTNGEKGVDPDVVETLLEQVKARDWSGKNFPIRELTEKDEEAAEQYAELYDVELTHKIKFLGPYEDDLNIGVIMTNTAGERAFTEVSDRLGKEIPSNGQDDELERLWFGSGWPVRTGLRLNAYDANGQGISAYAQTVYIRINEGQQLPKFGGSSEAAVLDDDDDWDE